MTFGRGAALLSAAWAGMIGPALFVVVFTLEGWLRPGYDPLGMYVSALSLGRRGWIQIANFIVLGVSLLVFARGVAAEFQHGTASRVGAMLLRFIATGLLLSGPFVMDPVGTARDLMTVHGTLHGLFGGLVFSLMPISCFVYRRCFARTRSGSGSRGGRWRRESQSVWQ